MQIFFETALVSLCLLSALTGGWMAKRFGKSYRLWFWLSMLLPVLALCVLLCLPENENETKPVGDEEIFDPVINMDYKIKKNNDHGVHFSARA